MAHDTTRLAALGAERAKLAAKLKAITPELHGEIIAARAANVGTVEVARLARLTRDAVRQIVNKRGMAEHHEKETA